MPPPPVVEDLEVIEQLAARRRPRGPRRVVDELDLQRGEEALGDGVVPAVAPPASCCRRSRAAPASAGSRRWRTDCPDPNDAAGPAGDDGEPAPSRGRRG